MARNGSIEISANITNSGSRDGDEVVQMYVRHLASKVARSIKELKGFERVTVPHGQTITVRLHLKASDLAYWDGWTNGWVVEPEPIEVQFATSSSDVRLKKTLQIR